LEVCPTELRRHEANQELRKKNLLSAAHGENMVLVQAARYLVAPYATSAQFVDIATLRHKHIAGA
jgi:hypothetical protein